jgi:hypothetical protein
MKVRKPDTAALNRVFSGDRDKTDLDITRRLEGVDPADD